MHTNNNLHPGINFDKNPWESNDMDTSDRGMIKAVFLCTNLGVSFFLLFSLLVLFDVMQLQGD